MVDLGEIKDDPDILDVYHDEKSAVAAIKKLCTFEQQIVWRVITCSTKSVKFVSTASVISINLSISEFKIYIWSLSVDKRIVNSESNSSNVSYSLTNLLNSIMYVRHTRTWQVLHKLKVLCMNPTFHLWMIHFFLKVFK